MLCGEKRAADMVLPTLTRVAAGDEKDRPCVAKISTGGSGYFIKMIQNGIEHGYKSAFCEAWDIMDQCLNMNHCLNMDGDGFGAVFDPCNAKGRLVRLTHRCLATNADDCVQRDSILLSISGLICRAKSPHCTGFMFHELRDAVVHESNDSEGKGSWKNVSAVGLRMPAPALTAAYYLRIASSQLVMMMIIFVQAMHGDSMSRPYTLPNITMKVALHTGPERLINTSTDSHV